MAGRDKRQPDANKPAPLLHAEHHSDGHQREPEEEGEPVPQRDQRVGEKAGEDQRRQAEQAGSLLNPKHLHHQQQQSELEGDQNKGSRAQRAGLYRILSKALLKPALPHGDRCHHLICLHIGI